MSRMPNPETGGINDAGFVSNIGSAVYFIMGVAPPFGNGDWFAFKSDGANEDFLPFTGDYLVTSVSQVGDTWYVYTTTVGTANVIGT